VVCIVPSARVIEPKFEAFNPPGRVIFTVKNTGQFASVVPVILLTPTASFVVQYNVMPLPSTRKVPNAALLEVLTVSCALDVVVVVVFVVGKVVCTVALVVVVVVVVVVDFEQAASSNTAGITSKAEMIFNKLFFFIISPLN